MSNKQIDWENLGFSYIPTDFRYVSYFKDGKWDEGKLTHDANIVLNECAGVFQYAQTIFEGLKAYRTEDNRIVLFRPELNIDRMSESAKVLQMPPFPKEQFLQALEAVVLANEDYVPPYGYGASLYIRPFMIGADPVIGVKPATEYEFRILCTPVGAYFKGTAKALSLCVSDYDRAAPCGTGHIKAGLNYAMSLRALKEAKAKGFDENLYPDARTRTYVEETGGANFLFVTKDNRLITPASKSILPSITRRSLLEVGATYLGLEVEEREIALDELEELKECGLCGTAAVISPVGHIHHHGKDIYFKTGEDSILGKLYQVLLDIQLGKIEAPKGWIYQVK